MSNGSTTWTYTYDANGMRTSRTNGTDTYTYVYNGGQLTQMTVGSNTLFFTYGLSGIPMTVTYNGVVYYYVTNLQEDVVALVNSSGTEVVRYTYDAWGNVLSVTGSVADTLGTLNPLRYRGYVYDTETGLYYLQSRYYDPEIGRFINADALVATGQGILGNNMFAYCRNNPVKRKDISGTDDICVTNTNDDDNPLNDAGVTFRPGGAGASGGSVGVSPGSKPHGENKGYRVGEGRSAPSSAGNKTITVYRAMSPTEYGNTMSSQKFSAGPNSYEGGKYFATTHENATQWGNKMYPNGDFKVMGAKFDAQIVNSPQTLYWNRLDGIGGAYFFSIADANLYMVGIR